VISFQKQHYSIFIRFTSGQLDRASGRFSLKSFSHLKGTLEYSELLDIIRTCCHIIRTAYRDFPNSVDFWNPTPRWILIDLASGWCCSNVWSSSSLSAGHWEASERKVLVFRTDVANWWVSGREHHIVWTVAWDPNSLSWNLHRIFLEQWNSLHEACDTCNLS
jgi:hypothetical protein